ncbi:hypothetical protein Q9Y00_004739 [Vibrio parahaemolyticus]|nr:hypothetical protein [Vibrio parahaemolyticus]
MSEPKFNLWILEQQRSFGAQFSSKITYYTLLLSYISSYFLIIFGLRPEQIRLLKWKDFTNSYRGLKSSEPFMFEGEGYLWPPELKQQDDEIDISQTTPLLVNSDLSNILFSFRNIITIKLKKQLEKSGYYFDKNELNQLILNLPVILNPRIFEKIKSSNLKNISVDKLYSELLDENWYYPKDIIRHSISVLKKRLHFESFRIHPDEYNITATRMRHTKGTRMRQANFSRPATAAALTHAGIGSVNKYYDVTPDELAELDDARGDTNLLIAAAEGHFEKMLKERIVEKLNDVESVIGDLNSGNLGESAHLPMCKGCTEAKPLSCYGCSNFKPLLTANHSHFLVQAENEYKEKLEYYQPHQMQGLADIILRIKLTIKVCSRILNSNPKLNMQG